MLRALCVIGEVIDMNDLDEKLSEAAKELLGINPRSKEGMAILGYALGAIYSIRKSIQYGYSDRTGENIYANYTGELSSVSKALSENAEIESNDWVSGYYFNSGLHRLAALNERATKFIYGKKDDLSSGVRREVNRLKHDVDSVLSGRGVDVKNAVGVCLDVCKFLKAHNQSF